MRLRDHLAHRLVSAALNAAIVGIAMLGTSWGIGAIIGLGLGAIAAALRDHRRHQRAARLRAVTEIAEVKVSATTVDEHRWS